MDRAIELEVAPWARRKANSRWRVEFPKIGVWRWYSFLKEQKRTAPRLRQVLVPSESSKRDVAREFGVGRQSAFTLGYQPYLWSAGEAQWRTPAGNTPGSASSASSARSLGRAGTIKPGRPRRRR